MKLVVDTNIVFSAVLHSNSRIARVLIAGKRHFQFHSCAFLHAELLKHRPKLRTLTGLSSADLDEVIAVTTMNIEFVDEAVLSRRLVLDTERLLAATDPKDVPFVALARKLRARLWTGDKALARGLVREHSRLVITTPEIVLRMEELEQ